MGQQLCIELSSAGAVVLVKALIGALKGVTYPDLVKLNKPKRQTVFFNMPHIRSTLTCAKAALNLPLIQLETAGLLVTANVNNYRRQFLLILGLTAKASNLALVLLWIEAKLRAFQSRLASLAKIDTRVCHPWSNATWLAASQAWLRTPPRIKWIVLGVTSSQLQLGMQTTSG